MIAIQRGCIAASIPRSSSIHPFSLHRDSFSADRLVHGHRRGQPGAYPHFSSRASMDTSPRRSQEKGRLQLVDQYDPSTAIFASEAVPHSDSDRGHRRAVSSAESPPWCGDLFRPYAAMDPHSPVTRGIGLLTRWGRSRTKVDNRRYIPPMGIGCSLTGSAVEQGCFLEGPRNPQTRWIRSHNDRFHAW